MNKFIIMVILVCLFPLSNREEVSYVHVFTKEVNYAFTNGNFEFINNKIDSLNKIQLSFLNKVQVSYLQGLSYYYVGDFKSSFQEFQFAEEYYFKRGKIRLYANCLIYKSFCLYEIGDIEGAKELLNGLLDDYYGLLSYKQLFKINSMLGTINVNIGNNNLALQYFDKCKTYISVKEEWNHQLNILNNNVGNVYEILGKYESAIQLYNLIIKDSAILKINDLELYARVLDNRANCYLKLNQNLELIEADLLESLRLRLSINSESDVFSSYIHLANFYIKSNDFEKAISYIEKTVDSEFSIDLLMQLYEDGDFDNPNFREVIKSAINVQKVKLKNFETISYDLKEKNIELEKLKSLNTNQKNIFGIVLLSSLMFLVILLMKYKLNASKKVQEKLQVQNLLERKEKEINKRELQYFIEKNTLQRNVLGAISMELHDNVLNDLIALRFRNESNENFINGVDDKLTDSLKNIEQSIRTISHSLYKSNHNITFEKELLKLLKVDLKLTKLEVSSDIDYLRLGMIKDEISFELIRIIKELLTNIIKHSGGSKVLLDIVIIDEKIMLCIGDNGVGIELKNSQGIGLKNIEKRILDLAGEWIIVKDSVYATLHIIKIPLL